MEITKYELERLVTDAAKTGAETAVRSLNTVNPADRPGGSGASSYATSTTLPGVSIRKAIIALREGTWHGAEAERDFFQASSELLDNREPRSITVPTSPSAYANVALRVGLPITRTTEWQGAYRALAEGAVQPGSASGASPLVPPEYLQSQFALSLQSAVAFRRAPGVNTLNVTSNVIAMPRESVIAASDVAAEAGTLTATDPTLAQQVFTIKKQYSYGLFSNELLNDSDPSIEQYVAKSLARSVALKQDLEFLEGDGTGNHATGMGSYTGLTTGYTAATNGDSYSASGAADNLFSLVYALRAAGVEPNAWIMHPVVLESLSKQKDSNNRYVMDSIGGNFGAPVAIPNAGTLTTQAGYTPTPWRAMLLGIPVLLSSQIPITETQGTASNATHIYLGDFNFAAVLERQAIEIAVSEHVAFNTDQTAVRAIARSAPALIQPAAFIKQGGIIP